MPSSNSELAWHATASANILQARKRRGLVGSKKSRNGCVHCKARRIKCDELPECSNCTSTGRVCAYEKAPKATSNTLGRHLSSALGLSDQERRTFDYFLSWTAPRLGGVFDKAFWCGSVLQYAQAEPIVLHALLAVSTLYEHPQYMKTFLGQPNYTVLRGEDRPPVDEYHASALRHYNKAIKGVTSAVSDGSASPALLLLTCILFMCIEVIRDDIFAAMALLQKGDALLSQFSTCPKGMPSDLFLTVKTIFGRLSVLSAQCAVPIGLEKYALMAEIPNRFGDLEEARTCLFSMMADGHAFLLKAGDYCSQLHKEGYLAASHQPYYTRFKTEDPEMDEQSINSLSTEPLMTVHAPEDTAFPLRMRDIELIGALPGDWMPSALQELQALCKDRFEQWHAAFSYSHNHGKEGEGEACLLMYYHISKMFLKARLSQYQTIFDQYTETFEEVVRLAGIYVDFKSHERPSFTFELGAVPALFVVALKCRIPSLRRKAIDLMHRSPGKECTFGAGSSGELAARIVAIEEEDLGLTPPPVSPASTPSSRHSSAHQSPINDSILPSEDRRVHNFELLANRSAQCFEVRVTRYSTGADGNRIKTISDYAL
ncbi:hypothetical protein HII31_02787 [Pseudocercospora fuligena]|uniref:Zn(2)-C6 fungal-type domain-containing protein n=1 Tax=Pseudocercospora fuligena TaxID=685502 RepID=A0A8H6RS83_9PEZI|nr:hypothetical protein HII31_02787 [Pseudocercospora fuligena]